MAWRNYLCCAGVSDEAEYNEKSSAKTPLLQYGTDQKSQFGPADTGFRSGFDGLRHNSSGFNDSGFNDSGFDDNYGGNPFASTPLPRYQMEPRSQFGFGGPGPVPPLPDFGQASAYSLSLPPFPVGGMYGLGDVDRFSPPGPDHTPVEAAARLMERLKHLPYHFANTYSALGDEMKLTNATMTWWQELAKKVLDDIIKIIGESTEAMGHGFRSVEAQARNEANLITTWVKDHPTYAIAFTTVVALGILVILCPYLLEALGFGMLGPTEGSWAAAWQSIYGGAVEAGSVFSYLQRMGMTWGRVPAAEGFGGY